MTDVSRHNGQLVYQIFGTGSEKLLAFHGFGQDGDIFKDWSAKLENYTIYAFDLFYHGKSKRENRRLYKSEWFEWVAEFLKKEGIERFSVLGFSLGGRFAISTALKFHSKIDEVILIAPDGIFLSPYYKLATTPGLRLLLKYLLYNPNKLERLIKINERSKIVNSYVADFVRKEMGNEENRKLIYKSWNYFKYLGYTKNQLIEGFNNASFKKRIILGNKDYVIHPKSILPLINKMGSFKVDVLPSKHHQLIKPEVADYLKKG